MDWIFVDFCGCVRIDRVEIARKTSAAPGMAWESMEIGED